MLATWFAALGSVIAVCLVSLIGLITFAVRPQHLRTTIFVMVSLAVGGMFGDAFIHLIPQSFADAAHSAMASMCILAGILLFFLLEKFLLWRHEHVPHYEECIQPVGYVSIVAEGLHNFIDGMLIAASYLVSLPIGLATTFAVLLHEIPHEIGNFGVLLHAGFSKPKAFWANFLSASAAIVGAITALLIGEHLPRFPAVMVPLTAGGFIYIAGSDLVPELHKERDPVRSAIQMIAIGFGVGLMLLLKFAE